jgi:hypothetical protein
VRLFDEYIDHANRMYLYNRSSLAFQGIWWPPSCGTTVEYPPVSHFHHAAIQNQSPVVLFFSERHKRALKNRGTEFSFSSVPTVQASLRFSPTQSYEIGGEPLEMGTLTLWAKTLMGPDCFPVPMMHLLTMQKGIT